MILAPLGTPCAYRCEQLSSCPFPRQSQKGASIIKFQEDKYPLTNPIWLVHSCTTDTSVEITWKSSLLRFINRAAMGRARFLIYPWFIYFFNRAAMGRARFLIYPWFIYFFNRAAMGRARFLIYPWFIIFFLCRLNQTSLGQN